MGQCCSKAEYELSRRFDENAWSNWDKHFARQYYDIDYVLGKGAFSEVVAATKRDTGRRVALKVVFLDNPRLTPVHAAILRDEVTIVQSLRHPNIVTFECVMEDPVRRQFVIAEEILHGGTLTEELGSAASNNDDRLLAYVFKQLLSALAHMHALGVVHRDLKPENIMFRSPAGEWTDEGARPVVIDFGMSTRVQPGGPEVMGLLGSPGFVAPEVISGELHTPAMDMFAIGVILYICIAGGRPMTPKEANTLTYQHYQSWEYPNMESDELWVSANERVRALVLQLLERDPAKRITAQQALLHPWVTADMRAPRPLSLLGDSAAIVSVRRSRLTAERRQTNVEEMLRYMVLALRARQHAQQGVEEGGDKDLPDLPLLGVQSSVPHPSTTSISAPQAGTATSFFRWMQSHMDDDMDPPTLRHPSAAEAAAAVAAEACDNATAAADELPELRKRLAKRSHSDLTHDAAASRSAAATAAAAWLHVGISGDRDPQLPESQQLLPPADLLVHTHLQRHLSLAQQSSGNLSAVPGAGSHTSPPKRDTRIARQRLRSQTLPVHAIEKSPGTQDLLGQTGRNTQDFRDAPAAVASSSSVVKSPRMSSGSPAKEAVTVVSAAAMTHPHASTLADDVAATDGEPGHARTRGSSVVDAFPLFTNGHGDRLYSVVLAATRGTRRRSQRPASTQVVPPACASSGNGERGDASVAASPKDDGRFADIRAVAQVEWGLRRWRQLARGLPSRHKEPAGTERGVGGVDGGLPEDMKKARDLAELALRFRSAMSSSDGSTHVRKA